MTDGLSITIISATLVSITTAFLAIYIVIPHFFKKIVWRRLHSQLKDSQKIYLTFDDGPSPDVTERLLDLLADNQVKATFFLRGDRVEAHPDLALRVRQAGHSIGQHGHAHPHGWKTGPFGTLRDLRRADATFARLGIHTPLYRPPFGKLNFIHLLYIVFTGKKVILWNLDPKDYAQPSADVIAQNIRERCVPGSVILLHDGRASAGNTRAAVTLEAIALLNDFFAKHAGQLGQFD